MPPGKHMAPAVRAATEAVITTTGITRGGGRGKKTGAEGPSSGNVRLVFRPSWRGARGIPG